MAQFRCVVNTMLHWIPHYSRKHSRLLDADDYFIIYFARAGRPLQIYGSRGGPIADWSVWFSALRLRAYGACVDGFTGTVTRALSATS